MSTRRKGPLGNYLLLAVQVFIQTFWDSLGATRQKLLLRPSSAHWQMELVSSDIGQNCTFDCYSRRWQRNGTGMPKTGHRV